MCEFVAWAGGVDIRRPSGKLAGPRRACQRRTWVWLRRQHMTCAWHGRGPVHGFGHDVLLFGGVVLMFAVPELSVAY